MNPLDYKLKWWIGETLLLPQQHSEDDSWKFFATVDNNLGLTLFNSEFVRAIEDWVTKYCSGKVEIGAYSYLSFEKYDDLIFAMMALPRGEMK